MKKYLPILPDILLIAGFAIAGLVELIRGQLENALYGSLFALGLAVLFTIQLIYKLRVVSIISGIMLLVSSSYMILALISEFREFPSIKSPGASELLFVGLSILLPLIVLSLFVIWRNFISIICNPK